MHKSAREFSVFVSVILAVCINQAIGSECQESDLPLLCHGARVARSVVTMKPVKLMDGVEIVSIVNGSGGETKSRSASSTGYAYADRVMQYLQSHEVKINLHEVLQKTGVSDAVARAMKEIESENEVVGE